MGNWDTKNWEQSETNKCRNHTWRKEKKSELLKILMNTALNYIPWVQRDVRYGEKLQTNYELCLVDLLFVCERYWTLLDVCNDWANE